MSIKVFVDMDGVLADFDGACKGPRVEGVDPPEMFEPGFFRNLKLVPGARWAITELLKIEGLEILIGTKPTTKIDSCASEKIGWLREHFPELVRKVHIVTDKNNLRGDYLIDDWIFWNTFPGKFIHFDKKNPESEWKLIVGYFLMKSRLGELSQTALPA